MRDAPPPPALPGQALVSRGALVEIVRVAVLGSYGVTGLADPLLGRLGLGRRSIRVRIQPDVSVDVHLRIAYGLPVAEVARQVDSAVRYALRRALGREVGSLTIHVEGLATGPFTSPGADPAPRADGPARSAGEDAT